MLSGIRLSCAEASLLRLFRRTRLFATSCSAVSPAPKQKVVVISWPTGAGKSRLSLELAKLLNGKIISADSVQVYKCLDIGSAKPSIEERQEVPHHLVDILHPSEEVPGKKPCVEFMEFGFHDRYI